MNKKTKNIVSVIQSVAKNLGGTQWMPSGSLTALHMTKSTLYSVLCTLCIVLFLASCAEETLVDNPHAQNAFRTVSVDLGMPQGKPAFGEGTTSRAADAEKPAEILLGDSTLAVSRTSSDTYYTTSAWVNDDQILVKIDAGSTQGRLTLQYIDPAAKPAPASGEEPQTATAGWYLMKEISYVKYTGDDFTAYNAQGVTPMIAGDTSDDDELAIDFTEELILHLDWTASQPTVSIIYAPDMQWSLAQDNTVSMEQRNPATTATTAPELWTTNDNGWTTPQARLRVNTGNGNAGDVVTLTSKAFVSALETKPQDNVYTATTDDQGDAYFYGTTNGVLKGNSEDKKFEIKLIQMRVSVPQPAPRASEGRSVALDDAKQNVIITLDTPITLLEASDVVPVTLDAETAYKLMAEDKRNTAKTENINSLRVIDGSCTNLDLITKQIETAMAMDIYDFTVINQLAMYTDEDPNIAGTVVGEAIRQLTLGADGYYDFDSANKGKISITLADATEVPGNAFWDCASLASISAASVTTIGKSAFENCNYLESISLPAATTIGNKAFCCCSSLTTVSLPKAETIGDYAFDCCNDLESVFFLAATTIGKFAFLQCGELTNVSFGAVVTSLGNDMVFDGVNTTGCDITLAVGQQDTGYPVTASNSKLMWADEEWKSIKVGETEYTAVGNELYPVVNGVPVKMIGSTNYAVIDGTVGGKTQGTSDDVVAMKNQIEAALNLPAPITNFYVMNGLAAYPSVYAKTVVGEAIRQITSGSVSLLLDDVITTLPDNAFRQCTTLTSVTTAATTLGNSAFNECSALESVNLTATSNIVIGNNAFSDCAELTNVTLPQNVNTTIGDFAFSYTRNLATINLEYVTSIGQRAFEYSGITNVNTPATLMDDGNGMSFTFYQCTNLKTVILSGATIIPDKAFSDCSNLEDVTLSAATTLGKQTFAYCNSFKSFTAGAVITYANTSNSANNSFSNVTTNCALTLHADQLNKTGNLTVSVSNGKLMWAGKDWKSITLLDGPNGTAGTKYYIDNGMPTVEIDGSVGGKTAGTPDDVAAVKTQIEADIARGIYDFTVINQLASYSNPGSAGSVVGEAIRQFGSNNVDTKITLMLADATVVPELAFFSCEALQSVTAPGAYQIGNAAFESCTNLQSVEIGENADGEITIGEYAFQNDANLGVIKFYKVVTSVEFGAFVGVNYESCDLFLNENQTHGDPDGSYWLGERWHSITPLP